MTQVIHSFISDMGPTGSRKSLVRATKILGLTCECNSDEVQAFRCPHPTDTGRSVVFVDTLGFNDINTKDTDILQSIADWLAKTYEAFSIWSAFIVTDTLTAVTQTKYF